MGSTTAEVRLVQLKNCFANIPKNLVNALRNANAIVQDVVVEIQFADSARFGPQSKSTTRSLYLGWTGMASTMPAQTSAESNGRKKREELSPVELDSTFGRVLGLADGQKVNVLLHLDPPLAHTVNIEPLTPADWEIIELHASFLESNLLFQVRALSNPAFNATPLDKVKHAHPLTIHLSPTSTANVLITSLTPPQPSTVPFAKIASDGEVIVAPKARPRHTYNERTTSRSIASKQSLGGRSTVGARPRNQRDAVGPSAVFLRGADKAVIPHLLDEEQDGRSCDENLAVWVDSDILRHNNLRRSEWVYVSVVKPLGLQPPLEAQQQQLLREAEASDAGLPTKRVVAQLKTWDNAPDTRHAALSSILCATLDIEGTVGGVIRLSNAPNRSSKGDIEGLKIYPFACGEENNVCLKLSGGADSARQSIAERLEQIYDYPGQVKSPLDGPLTDGQLLPPKPRSSWAGGILRFKVAASDPERASKHPRWCFGKEVKNKIALQQSIPNPLMPEELRTVQSNAWMVAAPPMVGIEGALQQVTSQLLYGSCVLLTGGIGSGKTSFTHLVAHQLRSQQLFHATYLSCGKLKSEETRVSTVKEVMSRLMMDSSWGSKFDGRSLIVLDDLDQLCPVETELQTTDNGRSRQISEVLCTLIRQHCGVDSKISLLITAQNRDSIHNLIIGGNVVKEIVLLRAPNKDGRRKVLEALTREKQTLEPLPNRTDNHDRDSIQESGEEEDEEAAWMGGPTKHHLSISGDDFVVDKRLDLLDIAGQTDGYMPADLVRVVSRAKHEAIIRTVEDASKDADLVLSAADFQEALKGFTPTSLRNVTLQASKTTFDSIGGLQETRRILLETLQYPTTYAPIFAQCPLRLRSGLLLYGYPGCGKTLLASAVAGECGLNFISVKGPEILNKYIGASEKSVRDLFERAESAKPCVLFFDEFDSIAPQRGHDSTGVTDRVVNQLLTQMDGAEGLSGVYVLAATSRPDLIDPALLRPGRLDKSLFCDMPSYEDRLDILKALARKLTIANSVLSEKSSSRNLADIAENTDGYSGADLQALIYNAHLEAIHDILSHPSTEISHGRNKTKASKRGTRNTKPDILQFRFGKDEPNGTAAALTRAQEAAEYAAIVTKLDALKLAKKKEKQARRGHVDGGDRYAANSGSKDDSAQKVVIEWKHMEASLASTRSSIGADERRRLQRIYHEFTVGRKGEMPDGQAANEIGARSSLM